MASKHPERVIPAHHRKALGHLAAIQARRDEHHQLVTQHLLATRPPDDPAAPAKREPKR